MTSPLLPPPPLNPKQRRTIALLVTAFLALMLGIGYLNSRSATVPSSPAYDRVAACNKSWKSFGGDKQLKGLNHPELGNAYRNSWMQSCLTSNTTLP